MPHGMVSHGLAARAREIARAMKDAADRLTGNDVAMARARELGADDVGRRADAKRAEREASDAARQDE